MNKKSLLTSILIIALCITLISGTTYALLTSETSVNIAVTSGKVDVRAGLTINALYSAYSDDENGTFTDSNGNKYRHVQQSSYDSNGRLMFSNHGTAYVDANGLLQIDRITPGDKVTVTLTASNQSNVLAKFRVKIGISDVNSKLAEALVTTIGDNSYTGLLNYRGSWNDISIGDSPSYNFSVELPMDISVEYQDLTTSMVITIEAVQGNARTIDEMTVETCTGNVSEKDLTFDSNGSSFVTVSSSPTNNPLGTNIEFAGFNQTELKSTLSVETTDFESVSNTAYTVIDSSSEQAVASIDLNLTIGNETVTSFSAGGSAKITTYVVKGLTDARVVYTASESSAAFGKNGTSTKKNTELEVASVGDYYYESSTGKLVFITNHFSEYILATNDALYAVNVDQNVVYTSFVEAVESDQDGEKIKLLDDIVISDNFYPTKAVIIEGKSISFDKGENLSLSDYPIWIETDSGKTNTFKDITISGNGGKYTFGVDRANGVFENVTINSTGNTAFCIQAGTVTFNNVTINNTALHTDLWRNTAIATAVGGSVIINSGTYSSENGYAVYIFSSGGTVTINNGRFDGKLCANIDRNTYSQYESHIVINGGVFTNVDFEIVGGEYATIEIKGGTFDSDPTQYVDTTKYSVTNDNGLWVVSPLA